MWACNPSLIQSHVRNISLLGDENQGKEKSLSTCLSTLLSNTPEPSDRIGQRPSYWSSKGEIDSAVPETLTYKLMAKLCVITEIHIQPFQVYFQFGSPIYSAKAVRFLMGHSIAGMEAQMEGDVSSAAQESCH
ncbi:unnamed protein product [Coffea canephora]|uniref:Uncharacterized protein n=1 Tax=Coffea canephora TaxID=49390 RepID=A0A068U4I8_COFCA|nr:unnamed protein product [Coffea canephora]